MEDAFLIFTVPIFTESIRQIQTTPKKVYAIDNGLIVANTFNLSENFGKLLENQVYLDLRRQGKKIFYYHTSDGYELILLHKIIMASMRLFNCLGKADDSYRLSVKNVL